MVPNQRVELAHVQADALRAKLAGEIVWKAMALVVGSRLWLGGVVSNKRDEMLINSPLRHRRHQ